VFYNIALTSFSMLILTTFAPTHVAAEEAETVVVAPQGRFSITVTDNPSRGYTLALKSMSEGVYFLQTDALQGPSSPRRLTKSW
jgi:hypothetical protein